MVFFLILPVALCVKCTPWRLAWHRKGETLHLFLPQKVCSAGSRKRCEQCLQHHPHGLRKAGEEQPSGTQEGLHKTDCTFPVCKTPRLVLRTTVLIQWPVCAQVSVMEINKPHYCALLYARFQGHSALQVLKWYTNGRAGSFSGTCCIWKWSSSSFSCQIHVDYCKVKRFLVPDHLQLHPDPHTYS